MIWFDRYGRKNGFIVYLLRYFLLQNWGHNLHINDKEFLALTALVFGRPTEKQYQYISLRPTPRCVSIGTWFQVSIPHMITWQLLNWAVNWYIYIVFGIDSKSSPNIPKTILSKCWNFLSQHIFQVWWTCFSTDSMHSNENKLCLATCCLFLHSSCSYKVDYKTGLIQKKKHLLVKYFNVSFCYINKS